MKLMLFEDFVNKEETDLGRKREESESTDVKRDLESEKESDNHKKSSEVINIPGWDQY